MTLESKKKLLLKENACFRCFKSNHVARNYRFKNTCMKCKKVHHFLMCPDDNIENANDKNKSEIYETDIMTKHYNVENVYLMTLMFKVKDKNVELKVRTTIDSGLQNSYVSKKLVQNLH